MWGRIMIKIQFLYFHLPSSSAGYVLVTRWQPVRQGVNDDPVYAKVAAPNVENWTLPPQTLQLMMLSLHVAPQMWWFSKDIFTLVVSCVAIFAGKLNQTCFFMWFLRIIHCSHLWGKCDCRASEEVEGLARTFLFFISWALFEYLSSTLFVTSLPLVCVVAF